MGQIMYRVYRYSVDDPFQAPRGWLAWQTPAFYESGAVEKIGQWSKEDAERHSERWSDYWSSKGASYRAAIDLVE